MESLEILKEEKEKDDFCPDLSEMDIEKVRAEFIKEKEIWDEQWQEGKGGEVHFKYINPDDLKPEDFWVYWKCKEGELTELALNNYSRTLKQFWKEQDCQKKTQAISELKEKFNSGAISDDEYKKGWLEILQGYDKERQERSENKDYVSASVCNSRATFLALIRNQFMHRADTHGVFDN